MAIAVRAVTTVKDETGADVALNIAKPSGTVDGDIMYTFIQLSSTGKTLTEPAGWTLVDSDTANNGSYLYRKAASSEPSTYDWSVASTAAGIAVMVSLYDDNTNSAPAHDVYTETVDTTADTTADNTGVTPTSTGNMLLAFIGVITNSVTHTGYAVANNNPSWTEGADLDANNGGTRCSAALAYAVYDNATATGAFSATSSASTGTAVYLVSVRPTAFNLSSSLLTLTPTYPTLTETLSFSPTQAIIATSGTVTVSEDAPDFTNQSKSSTTWTNQSKS